MLDPEDLPLHGTVVLDFSQFLAGPVAALRLADLGARVIKVERPVTGEIGRTLAFAGRWIDGDTASFHAMNRNKEAVVADLKDAHDLALVLDLVRRADVLLHNFRPGVMERLGLDHRTVAALNPGLVYASASGYGADGPWAGRPGQDLLAQSVSALPWVSAPAERPVPVGLSLADHLLSCHIAQGVVALLLRRARTGLGGLVETSLLEGMLDLQLVGLTTRLNATTPTQEPQGEATDSSPTTVSGLFATADGWVAVTAARDALVRLLGPSSGGDEQLSGLLRARTTDAWVEALDAPGVWCSPVLTLKELLAHDAFEAVGMTQTVQRERPDAEPVPIRTTRSPIRIDGERLLSTRGAPRLGAQGRVGTSTVLTDAEVTRGG
ncbi:Crotonobetainyl-CoA:carnitine CoA-transferase CaiB [Microlunatus sagamiharensis]|uniref:Crotonobetainyl-CoA:carnitine CoA-transferase CaiB n=1 Tax=Microlunatus sagamiharensis TaxID=546874 RepID=A0A1H2MEL3_9ACTN|nr:CoA transferase [Microlunatus sagamiharensis]SDU91629.1 Crotonobetainyl-CoA:carnitine CoA-transferase CaiB [Microlunatus sagamiharensis]